MDREVRFRRIDEREPHRLPARAKKAVAFFRMSRSWRRISFSRRSRFSSAVTSPSAAVVGSAARRSRAPTHPADQRRQPDPQIAGDLALRSPAGLHQADRFLLKFFGKPSLLHLRVPLHSYRNSPPFRRKSITLERDFAQGIPPVELVPQDMTRVLLNLFGRRIYAATKRQRDGAKPDFRPSLKVMTQDLSDAVEIRVRDNGVGISPEIKDKLFQPFFTTKPTGEGTGLGLSISYDIVTQQHGGTITVDSRPGEFTEFTIRLPRSQQPVMTEAAS